MSKDNKKLINRLKTIKGHIAGVERMVEEGKTCDEVLIQIAAIKSSINKVGLLIMEENALECLHSVEEGEMVSKEKVEEVIKTFIKYSK
ncbi:metal-sensitive transcriptional regulator [Helicovermis profundi]|uniref:Metal-sensing transcriptional repressor n=1 Tax=Helicovermis profundi TaxID=3065157 RepID=A0AAU9EKG8_9FIRM|nr:metal-sensing transcriptional repressor [Clostridia bacterium S502]